MVHPEVVPTAARRRFATFLVLATLFLIFAGAEVKSREAGLSVPDWPLSYGMVWPPMVGNVFYEHGHRAIAATVGLLTVILATWISLTDPRSWVRKLGWWCVIGVCVQGLLGGLTVLFLLPEAISMSHGTLAQIFLCLVAWLALAHGAEWRQGRAGADRERARGAFRAGVAAVAVIFVQLLLGAWVRHTEAGTAVPFFPVSPDGAWVPDFVNTQVVAHMIHRGFANVVAVLVLRMVWKAARGLPWARVHAAGAALLLVVQVLLGAAIIWTLTDSIEGPVKAPVPTSLHVVNGAALLVTCWLLTLRAWRASQPPITESAGAAASGASEHLPRAAEEPALVGADR